MARLFCTYPAQYIFQMTSAVLNARDDGLSKTVGPLDGLSAPSHPPGKLIRQGAEARIYSAKLFSSWPDDDTFGTCVVKERFVKTYRNPHLDSALSLKRMRSEARQLLKCRQLGLPVPALLHVNMDRRQLWMEAIGPHVVSLGDWLRQLLNHHQLSDAQKQDGLSVMAKSLGSLFAKMHANNIIHGDLTTANILVRMPDPTLEQFSDYTLYLIDFGLSSINHRSAPNLHDEEVAVDLYVFERALISSLASSEEDYFFSPEEFFSDQVLVAYAESYKFEVVNRTFDTPRKTPEIQPKKRSRCNSTSWCPMEEDGAKEVAGILKTLKDVEARGRKRLMVG